jgi:hypothetical protein
MSKNTKKTGATSATGQPATGTGAAYSAEAQGAPSAAAAQNKNATTLGKGAQDLNMASTPNDMADGKKAKEGGSAEGRTGGLSKLKDVHGAHEILEVAKQVP